MKCQISACNKFGIAVCAMHCINLCDFHLTEHNQICDGATNISQTDNHFLKQNQLRKLRLTIDTFKSKITAKANQEIHDIEEPVESILAEADRDLNYMMKYIHNDMSPLQVNELLEAFSSSLQINNFNTKTVNEINQEINSQNIFKRFDTIINSFQRNSVMKGIKTSDLETKIKWCQDQDLHLIPTRFIEDIKFPREANFCYVCINYVDGPNYLGKEH